MNLKNMMNMKTRWMLTAVVWTVLLVCVCQEGHAAAKAGSATVKVSETCTYTFLCPETSPNDILTSR